MAKKATEKAGAKAKGRAKTGSKKAVVVRSGAGRRSTDNYGDAFIKLLQSPLVAELVAVAATAALGWRRKASAARDRAASAPAMR